MLTAFIIIGGFLVLLCVLTAIVFCIVSAKCDEARHEIDFSLEEWRNPFL